MKACEGGHLDVVKYLCEIGGKELVMATDKVNILNCVGIVGMHVLEGPT